MVHNVSRHKVSSNVALENPKMILPGDVLQNFSPVTSIRLTRNNSPKLVNILPVRKNRHLWAGFQSPTVRATSIGEGL